MLVGLKNVFGPDPHTKNRHEGPKKGQIEMKKIGLYFQNQKW